MNGDTGMNAHDGLDVGTFDYLPETHQQPHPYFYPHNEAFPVVRIPVAGPKPFNTLVVVRRFISLAFPAFPFPLRLRVWRTIATPFVLQGYDQRWRPRFQHSTTISIHMLQVHPDSSPFVLGADTVLRAGFGPKGEWTVQAVIACMLETAAAPHAYVSSWVLCWEPPVLEDPHPVPYSSALRMAGEVDRRGHSHAALQPAGDEIGSLDAFRSLKTRGPGNEHPPQSDKPC